MSMSLRKLEDEGAKRTRPKHGVQSYLATGRLPSGRAWKQTQVEIGRLREDLIRQFGGDEIKPAVLALVESAIEGLTIQRLSALYVKKAGIMRRDSLKRGDLQLHSVLSGQFISYANLVRLNLEAAARLAAQPDPAGPAPTLAEIVAEVDAEEAAKASSQVAGEAGATSAGPAAGQSEGGSLGQPGPEALSSPGEAGAAAPDGTEGVSK